MPNIDHRVLELTTGRETLDDIQKLLDAVWTAHPVDELARIHTELAVSEIASNIVEHSGGGRPVQLRVDVQLSTEEVRITFTDDGHAAPVELIGTTMPGELAERGRGLAISHRVLDELSYRRDAEGNHWTLVRQL